MKIYVTIKLFHYYTNLILTTLLNVIFGTRLTIILNVHANIVILLYLLHVH